MWEDITTASIQAPLPVDMAGIRSELDYLWRQIVWFNSQLPCPRLEKNLKFRSWTDFDEGIDALLAARRDTIFVRRRWIENHFRRMR
jgi:hypothetical protein